METRLIVLVVAAVALAGLLAPVLWKVTAGFRVTLRQMFRKTVTRQYPETTRVKPQRFQGRHILNR